MAHPEYQLQDGKVQGMVLYCFEDERPMRGWIVEKEIQRVFPPELPFQNSQKSRQAYA